MSRPKSNEKPQEIERVSARLFAHNGYHRTTMRDIAGALQMNQASLYHYFPGKEDILFKLMNDAMDDAMAVLVEICAEKRPPEEKLRAVLQFYTRHYAGDQERLILLVNEGSALPEEKRRILVEKERRYVQLFKGLFQELADRNRMKAVPPSIATFAFFGMVHYTIKWYQKDGPMAPDGLAQSFAEILLQGVLQAPDRQACEEAKGQRKHDGNFIREPLTHGGRLGHDRAESSPSDLFWHTGLCLWMDCVCIGRGSVSFNHLPAIYPAPRRAARSRFDALPSRVSDLLRYGFLQTRQPRYLWAGVIHLIIFWGFVVLGLRSVDLVAQGLNIPVPLPTGEGVVGRLYGGLKDIFELLVLGACVWAALRRALLRPKRYEGSHAGEAYLVLALISCLMVTDMIYEGSGLLQLREGLKDSWVPAASMAASAFSGLDANVLTAVRHVSFWLHLLIFFSFLNLLPASKHFHIITALPNIFFKKRTKGAIKPARWQVENLEDLESLGVSKIQDFTWKHILDFCTCTECGRCSDNCPATTVGRPLSPKMLTMKLRNHAYSQFPVFAGLSAKQKEATDTGDGESDDAPMIGTIISKEEIWSCTTCGACEEECPVFIEYIDKMVDMRRHLIETAQNPATFNPVLRNIEKTGNPFGKPASKRADWVKDVSGADIRVVKPGEAVDVLYFVDSYGAYDPRIQSVAAAIAKGFHRAGLDFGILGPKEKDSGHQVRRLGEEGLFQLLREENTETLSHVRMKRIVTTDPHAFNCLKKDYGLSVEVSHYTQVLWELIRTGKLTPKVSAGQGSTVTYHDPCYLGRHNGIYDEPREIINALSGLKFVEMRRCRDRSFCCGGGDVSLWHEIEGEQVRMSQKRLDMALDAGADLIVTACPFCLIHLEDAVKTRNLEGRIRVTDLMELVSSTIEEG